MKTARLVMAFAASIAGAGCTSGPSSIEARYVSPAGYQSWSCQQLLDERGRLVGEVERVSGLQRENATADALFMGVGLILFWPALFGLAATTDRKDELGRLKGEYEAVDTSIRSKQCGVTPAGAGATAQTRVEASADNHNGRYAGPGTTESWCQTPSLSLTVANGNISGHVSELSEGSPTGTVSGEITAAGQFSVEIKSASPAHVNGRYRGDISSNTLNLSLKSRAAGSCTHRFALTRQ
jgi:hypothetical protein